MNPTGQLPHGDVKLTRRRSTAESYDSRDPGDPKMAALRSGMSGLAPMAPLPALPEETADRPLTMPERRVLMEQRKLRMQQRFQARPLDAARSSRGGVWRRPRPRLWAGADPAQGWQVARERAALLEAEMAAKARARGEMRNGYAQQKHQIYTNSSQVGRASCCCPSARPGCCC